MSLPTLFINASINVCLHCSLLHLVIALVLSTIMHFYISRQHVAGSRQQLWLVSQCTSVLVYKLYLLLAALCLLPAACCLLRFNALMNSFCFNMISLYSTASHYCSEQSRTTLSHYCIGQCTSVILYSRSSIPLFISELLVHYLVLLPAACFLLPADVLMYWCTTAFR